MIFGVDNIEISLQEDMNYQRESNLKEDDKNTVSTDRFLLK